MTSKKAAVFLSQTEVGSLLGVTRQRVFMLIKAGKIKAVEVAGRPVISKQEVERFAAIPRKGGRPPLKA